MQYRVQACVIGKLKLGLFPFAARMPLAGLLLLASLLAGCGSLPRLGGTGSEASPSTAALPPARPADPLAAFAAQAQPGQQAVLAPTPGAAPVPVRLVRDYFAASGHPCRELAVGTGTAPRAALYCGEPTGWAAARPLLRGGAVGRP
ncbi:hypothetical protein QMO56_16860 [Roseomonas sp. E05]|uniref:DVU3141 family protein n=1 Tax=Roseomonas sp. E05 TaxID=3046310 RepID=UPI0024BA627C|nr:DVU3141 family protein [Roseomonas sp. E05]MDJ0389785.1 hypothetical protein [Roseomonas sp. E05]